MARKHSPEELAEAQRLLKEGQPMIEQVTREQAAEDSKWQREIAMLERRVKEEIATVDLGNGDTLEIRACMSDLEMEEFSQLERQVREKKGDKGAAEATYRMLEMATANPLLTVDWFRENRDRYATADMAAVLLGFYEDRIKRQHAKIERVKSASTFRENQ